MFNERNVQVVQRVTDWQEAIRLAATPLVEDGSIRPSYVDGMIESVKELGFYIVLDEGLAMPHARPEAGVIRGGVSFMKVNEAVDFGGNPVHLIFVLAAENDDAHIERLTALMELFQDTERMDGLRSADDLATVKRILI
ncbi:MAG: PTS sugar transporter subunit IIA [Eubacteriales bacterium]|nr:PTS sugar transporter subunit IIA [Eubacteriales bacterium]